MFNQSNAVFRNRNKRESETIVGDEKLRETAKETVQQIGNVCVKNLLTIIQGRKAATAATELLITKSDRVNWKIFSH